MATSRECCHLPGEMLNLTTKTGDRAPILDLRGTLKEMPDESRETTIALRSNECVGDGWTVNYLVSHSWAAARKEGHTNPVKQRAPLREGGR
jgi:hypothetical protein